MTSIALTFGMFFSSTSLQTRLEFEDVVFDQRYVTHVSKAAFDKAPAWKDDAENPPVSARKAIALATEERDATIHTPKTWTWKTAEVSLRSFQGSWYWLVTLEAREAGAPLNGTATKLRVVVLMSGKAVRSMSISSLEDQRP